MESVMTGVDLFHKAIPDQAVENSTSIHADKLERADNDKGHLNI